MGPGPHLRAGLDTLCRPWRGSVISVRTQGLRPGLSYSAPSGLGLFLSERRILITQVPSAKAPQVLQA